MEGENMEEAQTGGVRKLLDGVSLNDLRYLVDRQAILDCIRRYARGVDRHDEELILARRPDQLRVVVGPPASVHKVGEPGS